MSNNTISNNIIVVGIGHPFRGDDSLGIKAIALLQSIDPHIETKSLLGDISQLLDIFANYQQVYLIDAIVTQQSPSGTRYRLVGEDLKQLSSCCRCSTHTFDIAQALELATNLGMMPDKLIIYGIEGQNFSHTEELSQPVQAQLPQLVNDLYQEIYPHARTQFNE
ncbi:MAG: hydrogenase maturation protease [Candidatus Berkiellales bacterium]